MTTKENAWTIHPKFVLGLSFAQTPPSTSFPPLNRSARATGRTKNSFSADQSQRQKNRDGLSLRTRPYVTTLQNPRDVICPQIKTFHSENDVPTSITHLSSSFDSMRMTGCQKLAPSDNTAKVRNDNSNVIPVVFSPITDENSKLNEIVQHHRDQVRTLFILSKS